MKFIADLHIHSRYSRATSKQLDPEHLSLWGQKKGIAVVGTGDFTHPAWLKELKEKLTPAAPGLYRLKPELEKATKDQVPKACECKVLFMLSVEISCIYKKDGKTRKLHHVILMPDFESAERLNHKLEAIGNITSDGRPILGLDSRDLLEVVLEADERSFFIPAHIWTPWFSLFGSKSGFDHIEECFGDLCGYIHALETGLSSDPPMNRLLSALDGYILVSNSDAHSPSKLGREANLFDTELDYYSMVKAMAEGTGFMGTIEFFPEEGKYHLDGHRKCGVRLDPYETRQNHGLCPECGKPLTVGVLHRVFELADRDKPVLSKDFVSLIPLTEILSEILRCGSGSKKVAAEYVALLHNLGPELFILMDAPLESIEKQGGPLLREAIERMRGGRVIREAGFDGEYGRIRLFEDHEIVSLKGQAALFQRAEDRGRRSGTPTLEKVTRRTGLAVRKKAKAEVGNIDPILDPLNKEQRNAVTSGGGHMLVKAGPGTGKTMTLTHRIAYLLREGLASPEQILALTFTRKAAQEMRSRLERLVGESLCDRLNISTFHSLCLEMLKEQREKTGLPWPLVLCGESDSLLLSNKILSDFTGRRPGLTRFRRALYEYKLHGGHYEGGRFSGVGKELLERYRLHLEQLGMVDLDDLEVETFRLLERHEGVRRVYGSRYKWIFVDEYQDTNPVQAAMVKMLVKAGGGNLFAIGDPDQAIYGFRGADVTSFYRFLEDFPGAAIITLKRSYRSTNKILQASASVLGMGEALESQVGEGDNVFTAPCGTEAEEAEMIVETIERLMGGVSYFSLDSGRVDSSSGSESLSFGDFAVLYRLNSQATALKEALERRGIPFIVSGDVPLIEHFPVNVVWRFLQFISNPENIYYREVYRELKRKHNVKGPEAVNEIELPDGSVEKIVQWAVDSHDWGDLPEEGEEAIRRFSLIAKEHRGALAEFVEMVCLDRGIDHVLLAGDKVALMTLHGAKGLEWPVVFIVGCEDGLIPCTLFGGKDDAEEARLFYVGMTRAERILVLSWARHRNLNGRPLKADPSRFLQRIPGKLISPLKRSDWRPRGKVHEQLRLF